MNSPSILVIQHVAPEPPSAVGEAISRAGAVMQVVRVHEGDVIPASIGDFAGLVVMGGPMGVYEADRHPHLELERGLIASALERRVPIIGICLGSQLLASVLGATVQPGRRKEIGWHTVSLEPGAASDPLFAGVPRAFTALHWHGDIFDLPPGAVALARSELTPHQAFCHGGFAWGILFHLEVSRRQLGEMTTAFADELAAEGITPRQILEGWFSHGTLLESLGARVFGLWMQQVQARLTGAAISG
jgi:GMP synthase (glutamine-hydrolysing)